MNNLKHGDLAKQLLKYAVVGIASNAIGYIAYLFATYAGTPPKLAMSTLYVVGASLGFFGNSRLTFSYRGPTAQSTVRYLLAHTAGYLLNLSILLVFVDQFGLPHELVQAVAILVVAGFLFLVFKFFVFPRPKQDRQKT